MIESYRFYEAGAPLRGERHQKRPQTGIEAWLPTRHFYFALTGSAGAPNSRPAAPQLHSAPNGANDLAHDWEIIDKYENNRGWVWVRVHRLA